MQYLFLWSLDVIHPYMSSYSQITSLRMINCTHVCNQHMLALKLITAPESWKTIGWYAMAVPPVQRYQSDVWEFLECVDAEEKVWCLLCNPPKAPSYTEALQTCVPPYPLKYNSNNKKQASLMFSVSAKRIFSKDELTLTRTFSYLNPNAVDAYYIWVFLVFYFVHVE